jgi:hypothetical protein
MAEPWCGVGYGLLTPLLLLLIIIITLLSRYVREEAQTPPLILEHCYCDVAWKT